MDTLVPWRFITASAIAMWFGAITGTAASAQEQFQSSDDAQVLTRGPIHEAYANQTANERMPNNVMGRQPPESIDELPPDQRPEGDNVTWITGYWAWDDDRNDYIWISGVWRDIPPNRQWIPGYWADVSNGYQYISGYWEDIARQESEYLPTPPEPIDVGPSSPAPGENYVWASGSWVWVPQNSYRWQPGYWVVVQPGWVWTPSYYVWTPRGHIYVAGYWDYDLPRRGLCFAPVYYPRPYYHRVGYYYSPRVALDINIAIGHFFIHASSHHYYFGDYYDNRYRRRGYNPCWSYYDRHDRYRDYDPIFVTYRYEQLRHDRDWDRHERDRYEYRRDNRDARPPRTFVATREIERQRTPRVAEREQLVLAKPLPELAARTDQPQRLATVNMDRRRELQARNKDIDQFRAERRQIETRTAAAEPEPTLERTQERKNVPGQSQQRRQVETGTPAEPEPTLERSQPQRNTPDQPPQRGQTQPRGRQEREQAPAPTEDRQFQTPDARTSQPNTKPGRGRSEVQQQVTPEPVPTNQSETTPQRERPQEEVQRTPTPSSPSKREVAPQQPKQERGRPQERTQPAAREAAPAQPEEQPRQVERRQMRQSPVMAKPGPAAKKAPATPDIPQPDQTRQAEPSRQRQQPEKAQPGKKSQQEQSQPENAQPAPGNKGQDKREEKQREPRS